MGRTTRRRHGLVSLSNLKRTRLYSEELNISLRNRNDAEYFKWFLASLLFGARISGAIAKKTYQVFQRYGLLTPDMILSKGPDFLVDPIMREGGYSRYDSRKSKQILRGCEHLLESYDGSLIRLHDVSTSNDDVERRLRSFYGVGPITVNIFLRELRPYWTKADPEVLPVVARLADAQDLDLNAFKRKTITFTRIEAGLIRLRA